MTASALVMILVGLFLIIRGWNGSLSNRLAAATPAAHTGATKS